MPTEPRPECKHAWVTHSNTDRCRYCGEPRPLDDLNAALKAAGAPPRVGEPEKSPGPTIEAAPSGPSRIGDFDEVLTSTKPGRR